MTKNTLIGFGIVALIVIAGIIYSVRGISSSSSTASTSPSAPATSINGNYTLHVGQSMTGLGVTATLISVDDSRCPIDVTCIQAGTVKAHIQFQTGNFSTLQTLSLGVPVSGAGLTGELVSVTPDKKEGVGITQSDYSLVFKVSAE